jgi:hypothetical protein
LRVRVHDLMQYQEQPSDYKVVWPHTAKSTSFQIHCWVKEKQFENQHPSLVIA